MRRLRIVTTLGMVVALAGCAGVHRRAGHRPITQAWEVHDPDVHSPNDPFVPQPQSGPGLGIARYFPGLNRSKPLLPPEMPMSPEPEEAPAALAEVPESRPKLGFRLFRRWTRPDPRATEFANPTSPDQLAHHAWPAPGRSAGPVTAYQSQAQPPRLPVAILAEVDPSSLPANRPGIAGPDDDSRAIHQRDAAARLVQARPDDVNASADPWPASAASESEPVPNPFTGFFQPDAPPRLAELTGQVQAESLEVISPQPQPQPAPEPAVEPQPVAESVPEPHPLTEPLPVEEPATEPLPVVESGAKPEPIVEQKPTSEPVVEQSPEPVAGGSPPGPEPVVDAPRPWPNRSSMRRRPWPGRSLPRPRPLARTHPTPSLASTRPTRPRRPTCLPRPKPRPRQHRHRRSVSGMAI